MDNIEMIVTVRLTSRGGGAGQLTVDSTAVSE